MSSIHGGHRQRVKEEFRKTGLDHFPSHKILELLLYYSIPRRDTNVVGHELIERFGSLTGVFDAPLELLLEVDGIGEEAATQIKITASIIKAYMDDYTSIHNRITDTQSAKEYMQYKFLCEQMECVYLACLSTSGKVVFCNKIAEGSPDTVGIVPKNVIKTVLRAGGVAAVIAHNHPGGICNPSSRDLQTTSILFGELKRVDVELIDHIIVAPDGVYSMKESGMLPSN